MIWLLSFQPTVAPVVLPQVIGRTATGEWGGLWPPGPAIRLGKPARGAGRATARLVFEVNFEPL